MIVLESDILIEIYYINKKVDFFSQKSYPITWDDSIINANDIHCQFYSTFLIPIVYIVLSDSDISFLFLQPRHIFAEGNHLSIFTSCLSCSCSLYANYTSLHCLEILKITRKRS